MKDSEISKDGQPPKGVPVDETRESFRLQKAMALLVLLTGAILALGGRDADTRTAQYCGIFLCFVGGIWLTVTRFRIWWRYGVWW